MTEYDDVAKCKLVLDLSTEQLESIENNGTSDAKAGRLFGDMNDADDLTEEPKAKLNNQTVTALNEIIVSLKNKPVDPVLLDKILNGTIEAPSSLMERFGTLFFFLVKSQIHVGKGNNGTPVNAYQVGYPLRDTLEKLQQHRLCYDPEMDIDQKGIIIKGDEFDSELPIYDFMFDEDEAITKCFWYILKMISDVI